MASFVGLVMLGPPGAGKGSIAQRITAEYGLPHVSSGAILRAEAEKGSALGKKIKEIIDDGRLVDDATMAGIIEQRLSEKDCEQGFILDGYPRNVEQAKTLEKILGKIGKIISKALLVDVQKSTLVERLSGRRECPKCGRIYHIKTLPPIVPDVCDNGCGQLVQRADDREEIIKKRFDIYSKKTKSLRQFYKKKGLLKYVDASGDIIENMAVVKKILGTG